MLLATAALLLATAALPAMGNANPEPRLAFDVEEGLNLNSFLREGPVAAHLLLRSGLDPRILIAFPAGNSGVGLWFSNGTNRKSTRLNSSHQIISYAVFCLKKKKPKKTAGVSPPTRPSTRPKHPTQP